MQVIVLVSVWTVSAGCVADLSTWHVEVRGIVGWSSLVLGSEE